MFNESNGFLDININEYTLRDGFYRSKDLDLNDFNIFHLNIRSINKNFDQFVIFLESLDYTYDIMVLTETFEIPDINLFTLEGYNVICSKEYQNRNDGVVVYIKNNIQYTVNIINFTGATALSVDVEISNSNIIKIIAGYRSLSNRETDFVASMNNQLSNQSVFDYLTTLYGSGFISYINYPTRVAEFAKTCIDHMFLKGCDNCNTKFYVLETNLTDHYATLV